MKIIILAVIALVIVAGGVYLLRSDSVPEPGRSERGDEVVEINYLYTNASSGISFKTGTGIVRGIFVSTIAVGPSMKVWDNTAASGAILVNTFVPVAATMYNFGGGIEFTSGLFVTSSGTTEFTVFYK